MLKQESGAGLTEFCSSVLDRRGKLEDRNLAAHEQVICIFHKNTRISFQVSLGYSVLKEEVNVFPNFLHHIQVLSSFWTCMKNTIFSAKPALCLLVCKM